MLSHRILSAAVLVPLAVAAVYLGDTVFAVAVLLVGVVSAIEFGRLVRRGGHHVPTGLLVCAVVALIFQGRAPDRPIALPTLVLVSIGLLTAQVLRGRTPDALDRWAFALSGAIYVGAPLGLAVALYGMVDGPLWVGVAMIGTWVCDTCAFFVGTRWGRRRFFPRTSPRKTLEGAIGGLVGAFLFVGVAGRALLGLGWGANIALGIIVPVGATFGDLVESVLKRQVGAKDSSHLIPGHGGMLDRVDSLLFVLPLVYLLRIILRLFSFWFPS